MRTAGFVLVGGQSSRMGRDKALLPWNSAPLVEDVATKVNRAAGNVALLGDPAHYGHLGYDCLPDQRQGFGPLAGIEAALLSDRGDLNLITACDMPGLQTSWLRLLLTAATESRTRCTLLLDSNGGKHPLCAVYRSDGLRDVQQTLEEGRLKLMDLVTQLDALCISVPDPVPNVNTPEEWSAWQQAGVQ